MGTETGGFWADVVPRVDPVRCQRCADCAAMAACLAQGFRRDGPGEAPYADENACFGCYSCVAACPQQAISLPKRRFDSGNK